MSDLDTLDKIDAPSPPQSATPTRAWRWQWLLAPLMGFSIVLHIALLFVPLPAPENPEEVEEAPPEADEEIAVDILNLSEIVAPEPPPEQPEQPPQPEAAPPPPAEVPAPPDPTQELAPAEQDTFEDQLPIDDGLDEQPPFDPGPSRNVFIDGIANLPVTDQTSEVGLPESRFFRVETNAVCFVRPDGGAVPEARDARWLELEPSDVFAVLQESYAPIGISLTERGDAFCGERYFEAFTAAGESFMTFSLAQLEGSTLLVIWETPPQ
ncbi:MAG: hypothetical protein AAF773_20090 [Cyanobacteria bacterium P01_D01_bin.115]